jgi:L-fucose dehydrogenase
MNMELDNKVILVVGGAGELGASVVAALAGEGAIPFILDTQAPLPELLARTGAPAQTIDFGDAAGCEAAVGRVAARFGRIDGLVNAAGRGHAASAGTAVFSVAHSLARYDLMTRYSLPYLRRVRGAIVTIADHLFGPDEAGYVALETGILGLTREWAAAFAGDGVRANAVIPARVSDWRSAARQGPKRRRASPGEVADTVTFLLSNRAALTTGQWLYVDGGYARRESALV